MGDVQAIRHVAGVGVAVVEPAGELDAGPLRLLRLIAASPVRGAQRIGVRVGQFEARAATIRPFAPASALLVRHLGDDDVDGVREAIAQFVRRDDLVGLRQREMLARVAQRAAVVAEGVVRVELRVVREQARDVLRDDHSCPPQAACPAEFEVDPVGELPAAEIDGSRAAVEEFDVLVIAVAGDRVEHDFVDDDVLDVPRGVCRCRGREVQAADRRRAVGGTAGGKAVLLSAEFDRIEDALRRSVEEVNGFARRAEREAELVLVERHEAARGNPRVRDAELVRRRIIGEPAAGEVHLDIRVVVKLDEIKLRIIGVTGNSVDDDVALRDRETPCPARRASRRSVRWRPRRVGCFRRSWAGPTLSE